jgi:hypothetical protein
VVLSRRDFTEARLTASLTLGNARYPKARGITFTRRRFSFNAPSTNK